MTTPATLEPFAAPATGELAAGTSLWLDAWKRLRKNRLAVVSAAVMSLIVAACVAGPTVMRLVWGYTYDRQNLNYGAQPPTFSAHTLVPGEVVEVAGQGLVMVTPWGELPASEVPGAEGLAGGTEVALRVDGRATDLESGDIAQLRVCARCTQVSQPSTEGAHFLGTDFHGRDLATRMWKGGQISLLVGLLAAVVSATIGIVVGAVAGYRGGRVDAMLMRFVDIMYSLPYMFFVIILVTVLGKQLWLIFVALGAVGWLTTARIVRGQVLSLKEREFVLAATGLGLSRWRVLWRHILPNALGPIVAYATIAIGGVILAEAALSYLGVGSQDPTPAWGLMVEQAKGELRSSAHSLLFPAGAIVVTVLSFLAVGEGLRDAVDPDR